MKAELLLATLSLVAAVVQAKYMLSCAESELGVRWPSYDSNSEYYVCPRLFGKQMTVTCNPGQIFSYSFQSCDDPDKYIPPPALNILPTASPLLNKPNEDGYLTHIEIPNHPPVKGSPPVMDIAISRPPVTPPTIHEMIADAFEPPKQAETQPDQEEENYAVVEEPINNMVPSISSNPPTPPTPPTPPPTPRVVDKIPNKKPNSVSNKKPSSKKKKSTISNTAVNGNKPNKKPSKASAKKPAAKKNAKQSSQSHKTPKKSGKKPKATDKKTQKS